MPLRMVEKVSLTVRIIPQKIEIIPEIIFHIPLAEILLRIKII